MTQKRCKHIEKDGFHTCGSYAFNLCKDGIEQGDLCDVHYWQHRALAVPDAIHHTDLSEHPQYIEGWNDCKAEMLKGMK
jgi:hypothetical protein